jgi:hypothetical protein
MIFLSPPQAAQGKRFVPIRWHGVTRFEDGNSLSIDDELFSTINGIYDGILIAAAEIETIMP